MPMAPGQPLFLMHCGVNRITQSGRIAGENQRVSREGALRAVTLDAAHSLQMEKEVGSIIPGKLANFTILADNPVTCDAGTIKDIAVIGTIHEGHVFRVKRTDRKAVSIRLPENFTPPAYRPVSAEHFHTHAGSGCACAAGKAYAELIFPPTRN
jgi:adenine deaminase